MKGFYTYFGSSLRTNGKKTEVWNPKGLPRAGTIFFLTEMLTLSENILFYI